MTLLLAGLAMCVLLQGFFSGSEIALVSADRLRLQAEADAGRRGSRIALSMLAQPTRTLGTCLLGTNICVISAGTLGVVLVQNHLGGPHWLAALLVVPFTLTVGEMIPKALYQYHADRMTPLIVYPLQLFGQALRPVLWMLEQVGRLFEREGEKPVTREEIRLLLEGVRDVDLTDSDKQLIRRVFAFSEATVEEAMVPLIDVVAIPDTATLAEAAERMTTSGHSRLPVYHERVDRITGVVFHHDVLATDDWQAEVSTVSRLPLFVPESKPVDQLLPAMRRARQRMAVPVDEYGGAVGIITVEDVLEEIVGEIEDESDRARAHVRRVSDREWLAQGRAEREHLEQSCGLFLPDGEFETIAGFVLTELGRVPARGERVELDDFVLVVSKANDRAILEVTIRQTTARPVR